MKRLNTCRTMATALVFCLAAPFTPPGHAQTALASNPVVGTWSWTLFNSNCAETLRYRADGVLLSTSGEAVTEWRYAASNAPDAKGFYGLLEISIRHNAK